GLVSLVINALVLMMAANLVPWFSVDNFMGALVGSLLIAVFNALLKNLVPAAKDDD
ncbi:MAG: phage holin family protein, partial [Nitrospirae bacterium]|nr:phage holin family protein [Fimbriimonadaceae bacterium]